MTNNKISAISKWLMIVFVLIFINFSSAEIIYVDSAGPNDPGTGTSSDPFRSLQPAIDSASIQGDTIEIKPGLYTGTGNYDIQSSNKSLTIRGIDPNDPNIVKNTIIDAENNGRCFDIRSDGDNILYLQGLTLSNGTNAGFGGGIYIDGQTVHIYNCVIKDNSAAWGGAINISSNDQSTITGCVIKNNTAEDGAGIECYSAGNPTLINCILINNVASGYGGALDCSGLSEATIISSTIVGNEALYGDAIYAMPSDSFVTVNNSIIWSNGGIQPISGPNTTTFSDVDYIVDGTGNIYSDPCFADFNPASDPNLWDLHLKSVYGRWDDDNQIWVYDVNTSDCIDAGDPALDWNSEPWPNGKTINMGAFGGTTQASKNGNPADFDLSGNVDSIDYAEFSSRWSTNGRQIYDLSGNDIVDMLDLQQFVENWLWP